MKKWWVIFLFSPVVALAQFDEGEDEGAAEPVKTEVDNKDLKALSEARMTKSEESIVRAASKILGVDPKNVAALNALALHYFEQGKLGLARMIVSRALQDNSSVPGLHNNLAIIYLAEGKQRLALAEFRKAIEHKPDYRIGAANLGSIFLDYKDYERAMAPLEAGYRSVKAELKSGSPSAIEVANNYAVALSGLGKLDEARAVYQEIVANSSRQPIVLMNFAVLLVEKLKDYKEGSKLISKIKFAVDDPKVLKKVEELEAHINASDK